MFGSWTYLTALLNAWNTRAGHCLPRKCLTVLLFAWILLDARYIYIYICWSPIWNGDLRAWGESRHLSRIIFSAIFEWFLLLVLVKSWGHITSSWGINAVPIDETLFPCMILRQPLLSFPAMNIDAGRSGSANGAPREWCAPSRGWFVPAAGMTCPHPTNPSSTTMTCPNSSEYPLTSCRSHCRMPPGRRAETIDRF